MNFPTDSQFFFNSAKGRIHYRLYRHAEESNVLCILPGFSFPASVFHHLATELQKKGNNAIVVDYWGRGYTSPPKENDYSLESNKNLVISLLEHLNISKCTFIGFSYGCAIVSLIAETKIELVNKIVLISPFQCDDRPMTLLQQFVLAAPIKGPMIFKVSAKTSIPETLRSKISDNTNKEEIIGNLAPVCIKHANERGREISKSVVSFDFYAVEKAIAGLADINKQILVICGSDDKLVNATTCQNWWFHWVPNSTFNIVQNSGHLVFLEQTDECVKEIEKFVK